eukprot:2407722-Lingulodinium_polyedra.AAC.1
MVAGRPRHPAPRASGPASAFSRPASCPFRLFKAGFGFTVGGVPPGQPRPRALRFRAALSLSGGPGGVPGP